VEEHGKNGSPMLEIANKALPADGVAWFEGSFDSDKLALVLDGDLIVLVVDAGAFVLAPARADDDFVATQIANCKAKTLPISPNLDIGGICGVQYMGAAVRHVGREIGLLGIDTQRTHEAPGHKADRRPVVQQNPHNQAID